MLDSIEIKNFKRIGEDGLKLDKLAQVNYLVGENGSGKSSLLEAMLVLKTVNVSEFYNNLELAEKKSYQGSYLGRILKSVNIGFCITIKEKGKDKNLIITKTEAGFEYQENIGSTDNYRPVNNWPNGNYFTTYINPLIRAYKSKNGIVKIKNSGGPNHNGGDKLILFNNLDNLKLDKEKDLDILKEVGEKFELEIVKIISKHKFQLKSGKKIDINLVASGFRMWFSIKKTISDFIESDSPLSAIIIIEEPEISLHPKLQKQIPSLLKNVCSKRVENGRDVQFFISTHSPFIISSALSLEEQKVYHIVDGTCPNPEGLSNANIVEFNKILDSLGSEPGDILFANCIFWVEGPSDRIYIKHFLESLGVKEHEHYEFSFYGGSNLSHYEGLPNKKLTKKETEDLIQMMKINTRCILYMDSDKVSKIEEIGKKKTKERVKESIEKNGGLVWISEGREIENYFPKQSLIDGFKIARSEKSKDLNKERYSCGDYEYVWKFPLNDDIIYDGTNKVDLAKAIVDSDLTLEDCRLDFKKQIEGCAEKIKKWNNLA